jgi:predicted RNA-binding Zn ribbon-like protein
MNEMPPTELLHLTAVPRRDLGVEWVNTLMWRGSDPADSLHNLGDVISWLETNRVFAPPGLAELSRWLDGLAADQAGALLRRTLEIRETLHKVLCAAATTDALPREQLQPLNELLRTTPARDHLTDGGSVLGWKIELNSSSPALLTPILWSVADLVLSVDTKRLRQCANERCLWLFLDDSKSGTRRWCSMQACGNRAKAHRHYQRHKSK